MNELATLEQAVMSISPKVPVETIAELLNKIRFAKGRMKEIESFLEEKMFEWIEENRTDICIGAERFYVAVLKKTRCRDQCEALQALVEQYGPEQVGRDFLSSGALKYGAIREADPELFERLFVVEEVPELKEGKPQKRLRAANVNYLK